MEHFDRTTNGFNYVFERELAANETIIVKMPTVSPNKRGINDIGWQCSGEATLYGTLSKKPETGDTLWQEIYPNTEINRTTSALKIVNDDTACKIIVRVLLN